MKTIRIANNKVEIYDSIDDLPILRYQKFNKCLLIDSGIGSSVNDIDSHITKIAKFITLDNKESALQELQNMRQNFFMITSGISPKYLAFGAMIKSVNGVEQLDLSDEALKALVERLNINNSLLSKIVEDIKKNLENELDLYWPNEFKDKKDTKVFQLLQKQIELKAESIIADKDNSEEIRGIDEQLFTLFKPQIFYGNKSVEIAFDKNFEVACTIIAQETSLNAREMNVLQFYETINTIRKQAEEKAKAYNKIKGK